MDDVDTIPAPANSGAKAEVEHLRSLVAAPIRINQDPQGAE
jgi:hypothetical protein